MDLFKSFLAFLEFGFIAKATSEYIVSTRVVATVKCPDLSENGYLT